MNFHDDPLATEMVIRRYLNRTLDVETSESFASHYLECARCFTELRASELLMAGLRSGRVDRRVIGDVAVFQLDCEGRAHGTVREIEKLCRKVLEQEDTKVLIDLSGVSRIDSAGLGMLMQCYSHIIRNRGVFKLLNPNAQVLRTLSITRIDSVVEAYADENEALLAFNRPPTASDPP